MTAQDLVLTYEDGLWHARGDGIELAHEDLHGLDALIEARLASDAAPVEVRLEFDTATLPRWVLQYHGHYCNYSLLLPPRRARP